MYKYGEHTADLEVFVEAESFEKLIEESVKAVSKAIASRVEGSGKRKIEVEGSEEEVLFEVLEEVVFLQSQGFYVKDVKVKRRGKKIVVELIGGKARAKDEIKAITWHEFWVRKNERWEAHFICDV